MQQERKALPVHQVLQVQQDQQELAYLDLLVQPVPQVRQDTREHLVQQVQPDLLEQQVRRGLLEVQPVPQVQLVQLEQQDLPDHPVEPQVPQVHREQQALPVLPMEGSTPHSQMSPSQTPLTSVP